MKPSRFSRGFSALLILGAVCWTGWADDEREGQQRPLRGQIKEIDAKVGTISIRLARDGASDEQYNLTKNAKVTLDGKPGTLEDLKPGMVAHFGFDPVTEDVTSIRVEGPTRRLTIRAVDAGANSIRVSADGLPPSVPVARDAKVIIEGKPGKLEDVKPSSRVVVTFSADQKSVVAIEVGAAGGDEGDEGARERRRAVTVGSLKAVDPAKNTLTLIVRGEAQQIEKTFTVSDRARISLGDERPAKLEDLKPDMRLRLTLGDDRTTVVAVSPFRGDDDGEAPRRRPGDPARNQAVLKAVDTAKGTVTVTITSGDISADTVLPLDRDFIVLEGERQADASILKEGRTVILRFGDDRKTVKGIHVIPTRGDRERE